MELINSSIKIKQYIELLKEYNSHTNIYSSNAYDKLHYHINDSIILSNIIKDSGINTFDMGSGSGLPSIIIAIINPTNNVFAIESKSRKTKFLHHIKKELDLNNLTIINQNIFELSHEFRNKASVITAKAFAPYPKILQYAKKLHHKKTEIFSPISKQQVDTYKKDHPNLTIITKTYDETTFYYLKTNS